ncbi:hypothetical protein QEN19_003108 [Hanseniaspora menglaensis]
MSAGNTTKPVEAVISIYDYHSQNDGKDFTNRTILSFQKDTIIYLMDQDEGNEWRDGVVFTHGRKLNRGWFPITYCRKINIINDNYYYQQQKINSSNFVTQRKLNEIIKASAQDYENNQSGIKLIRNVIRYKYNYSNKNDLTQNSVEEVDDTIYTLEKYFKTHYFHKLNKYVFFSNEEDNNFFTTGIQENSQNLQVPETLLNNQNDDLTQSKIDLKHNQDSEASTRKNSENVVHGKRNSIRFSNILLNDPNLFFINENRNIESYEYLHETIKYYLKITKEAVIGKENYKILSSHSAGTIKTGDGLNGKIQGFLNNDLVNWTSFKYHKGSYYDFNYNLNIVCKHVIMMQTALRIYTSDKSMDIHRKTRKRIKQLLKILGQSLFTIAVNTYLYFNSKKFNIYANDSSSSSLIKSVTPFTPNNGKESWKEPFSSNEKIQPRVNNPAEGWSNDEIDPKFKVDFKRNSSAATIKLSDMTNNVPTRFIKSPGGTSSKKSFATDSKKSTYGSIHQIPSVTSSNFLSNFSAKGVHIDLLLKSIFEGYNNYEIVLAEIFQILFNFQKHQSENVKNSSILSSTSMKSSSLVNASTKVNSILQLTPHFLKDSLDKNYWENIDLKKDSGTTSFSGTTLSAEKHGANSSSPSAIDLMGFDNINTSKFSSLNMYPEISKSKASKTFVSKEFVKNFNNDLKIIIEKTNLAVTVFEQPQSTERDIKFVYCVSNVLKFNTNLLEKFDSLDFEMYRYLIALDFNPAEDGVAEYRELTQWKKHLLDNMRVVLLEYSEVKQKFHEMVSLGVLYTQQICFQDPFVFSSMRNDYFYDNNAVVKNYNPAFDKPNKNFVDEDVMPLFKNLNGGSITTLSSLPKKYSKSSSSGSLASLQKSKKESMEIILSLLTRQMIFEDVETNTTDFIDSVELLKEVMKDFLNNFNQLIAIVDQIASITESLLTSGLSFLNNPKVAALLTLINTKKEQSLEKEVSSASNNVIDEDLAGLTSQSMPALSNNSSSSKVYQQKKQFNSSFFELQNSKEGNLGNIVMSSTYSQNSNNIPVIKDANHLFSEDEDVNSDDEWLLKNEYDDFLIYDEKTAQVKAGTKMALIEHLTSHTLTDPWFNEVMFQNFKTMFSSTVEFFSFIMMRYNLMPQEGLNYREYDLWVKRKLHVVKLSCYLVIFEFLEHYWFPQYLENDLLRFNYILELFKEDKMPDIEKFANFFNLKIMEPLRANMSDKNFKNKDKDAMSKKYATKFISSHLYLRKFEFDLCPIAFNLMSFSPAVLASNLTLKEFDMFKNINSLECLDRVLNNKHTWQGGSPNIRSFINMSNLITNFTIFEIVRNKHVYNRARTIEHAINVVEELFKINNFSAMTSIISALSASPVFRLKKTWALVSAEHKEKFLKLSKVVDSNKNFNVYREMFNKVKFVKPALPFFGVYLSDLIFTQMGNPDLVKVSRISEPLINYNKRIKLQLIIKEIKQLQKFSYNDTLTMDADCMWFIETYCYKDPDHIISKKDAHYVPDIDHLYSQSLILEPKSGIVAKQTIESANNHTGRNVESGSKKDSELRKSLLLSKVSDDSQSADNKCMFVLNDTSGVSSSNSSIHSVSTSAPHVNHATTDYLDSQKNIKKMMAPQSTEHQKTQQPSKHKHSHSIHISKGSLDKPSLNILSSKKTKHAAFNKLMHYEK